MRALAPILRGQHAQILRPTAHVLPVHGEAGSGKTWQGAAWVESGVAVLPPLMDRLERENPGIQRVQLVRTDLVDEVVDRSCRRAATIFDSGL